MVVKMETVQKIDGLLFEQMLQAGCASLRVHAQEVNDLNVFPIPDGDTGDNMLFTMIGGATAAKGEETNLAAVAREAADGMLLSARGNSGVILSQLFAGFAEGVIGVGAAEPETLLRALKESVKHAYDAVMEPVEGTMLTVFRLATESISQCAAQNPEKLLDQFLKEARRALEQTPDMLPVLKKAGVVDSGGAGLLYIGEGMLSVLKGSAPIFEDSYNRTEGEKIDINDFTEDSVLEYGYCTELLLRLQNKKVNLSTFTASILTDYLSGIGDSVVSVQNGSLVKIHVHTMTPDKALAFCQQYGEFLKVKIENMSLQHQHVLLDTKKSAEPIEKERKPFGVIAVAAGEGIKRLFLERGADDILEGGQSMNPSTADFLRAFERVNANTIYVFPNNGNLILTAKQAASLYTDAQIRVIPSRTVGEGYAALSMLSFESGEEDQIEKELIDAMKGVTTAAVSHSVRDTENIRAGEYIGFVGKEILSAHAERRQATLDMLEQLEKRGFDICILIYGKEVEISEASQIEKELLSRYPGKEIYRIDGGQEVYDYIMILE